MKSRRDNPAEAQWQCSRASFADRPTPDHRLEHSGHPENIASRKGQFSGERNRLFQLMLNAGEWRDHYQR
jgi:hypothetical protein